jgi:peptidyl-prolyl cis-trans isomerase D
MPVMENIRLGANNPWMKALFACIVLVFVFWGIGTGGAPTNQVIAEVNGERITDTQFQRMMRDLSRSQQGAGTDEEQQRLAQQVVTQLIQKEVLLQEVDRSQIAVSKAEIALVIREFPAFQGSDGKFSGKMFAKTLKRMGLTEGKFEKQMHDDLAIQKLQALAASGIQISEAQVKRQYLQVATQVSLKVLRIPNAALLDDVPVEEGALDAFVTANESDIRSRYEADYRRLYKKSRRATLSQIMIRTDLEGEHADPRPRLEKILAKARSGKDFAKLARIHSEDINARHGGALGTVAEEQLEKTVAEAVFAGGTGAITDILPVKGGLIIAKVDAIFPSEETPFDTVKKDIARTLTQERNVASVADDFAKQTLADWSSLGAPDPVKLLTQKLSVQQTGMFPVGRPSFPGLADSPALMSMLTNASSTGLFEQVFEVPGGKMIVELTAFEKPADDKWEAEKGLIRTRLEYTAQQQFVGAWVEDLVAQADVKKYYNP